MHGCIRSYKNGLLLKKMNILVVKQMYPLTKLFVTLEDCTEVITNNDTEMI